MTKLKVSSVTKTFKIFPFFNITNFYPLFRARRAKSDRSAKVATSPLLIFYIFSYITASLQGQVCPVVCLCRKTGSRKFKETGGKKKEGKKDERKCEERRKKEETGNWLQIISIVVTKYKLKTFKFKNLSPAVFVITLCSRLLVRLRLRQLSAGSDTSSPTTTPISHLRSRSIIYDPKSLTSEIRDMFTSQPLIRSLFKSITKLLGDDKRYQQKMPLSLMSWSQWSDQPLLSFPSLFPQAKNAKIPQDKKLMDLMSWLWKWMVIIECNINRCSFTNVIINIRSLSHVTAVVLQ